MRKKNYKNLNIFEQKMNQSKNLYHQINNNKHYFYATINLDDSIETNNENTKENYIFHINGSIPINSKKYLKNQNIQTSTLNNKRSINSGEKNEKKIFELKKMNIYSKVTNFKKYFRSKNQNEIIMKKEENKEDTKEEKKDKDNCFERPEDISDYINIENFDEQDYNYKTLSGRIENEAIEEVEEAKEASELRQSSDFYNNISGSKSNPKKNMKDIWIKKNIYQKKDSNRKNKDKDNNSLFSKYLIFNKKEMNNKNNKIISKIGYKKSKKNISPYKSSIYSNISINSNDHKNATNFEIPDYCFNKSDRDNLIFKKNNHLRESDYKNRTSNNSNKNYNIYLKGRKNEYLINKDGNKIKRIIIKLEYNNQREISLKSKKVRKLDKNKNTSQTVPNLKKYYNNKNKENGDMINCMEKIIKNYSNGNKVRVEKLENKNKCYEESKFNLMKSMKISKDYKNKRNEFYETNNKYCKLFYSRDKTNKLNKTNDRIKVPIKIYNNYFNNDDKTRVKKAKQ